jgi:hypothetical protein
MTLAAIEILTAIGLAALTFAALDMLSNGGFALYAPRLLAVAAPCLILSSVIEWTTL